MKCLQCKKDATATTELDGVMILECLDGHRTGQLTAKQEKEIMLRIGVLSEETGEFVPLKKTRKAKKAAVKGIPATMYDIFDKPRETVRKVADLNPCEGGDHNPNPLWTMDGGSRCVECDGWISDDAVNEGD